MAVCAVTAASRVDEARVVVAVCVSSKAEEAVVKVCRVVSISWRSKRTRERGVVRSSGSCG